MPGAVDASMEGAAMEWEKKLPEVEEKNSPDKKLPEEKKPPEEQVTSSTSTFDEKCLQHLDGSEKMQVLVDGQKATSESGSTMINKEHVLLSSKHQVDAHEHMLALLEEEDDSEKVRLQKKKVKKRKSSELEKMKKEKQVLEEPTSKASYPLRWRAYFSTTLLLRIQKEPYKGSILLDREVNRVTLLNDEEMAIDHCYIKEGDLIYPELMLDFRCHKAKIGKQIIQANKDISLPTTADEGEGELQAVMVSEKKEMLRETLKNCGARVSLTADMWTSNQRLGYMCITCHFIDKTWKLQKRILRFCMLETPHNGFQMYNTMLKSLQYWNIEDKICNITLDNASVNGRMMDYLKENLTKKQMLTYGGKLFHIRCAAHVLNLVVQDGLFVMKGFIDKIRESVKYMKSSQSREELFQDIVQQLGIISQKEPSLDVATRWNSMYLMIDSSLPYMEAFDQLANQDRQFQHAPSAYDWKMAEAIRSLLQIFFEATNVVSGSSYPTLNRYFHEIWTVRQLLETHASNKNTIIASMVRQMQKKFYKY